MLILWCITDPHEVNIVQKVLKCRKACTCWLRVTKQYACSRCQVAISVQRCWNHHLFCIVYAGSVMHYWPTWRYSTVKDAQMQENLLMGDGLNRLHLLDKHAYSAAAGANQQFQVFNAGITIYVQHLLICDAMLTDPHDIPNCKRCSSARESVT